MRKLLHWLRARLPAPCTVARRAVQAVGVVALVVASAFVVVPILGIVGAGIAYAMGDPRPLAMGVVMLRGLLGI